MNALYILLITNFSRLFQQKLWKIKFAFIVHNINILGWRYYYNEKKKVYSCLPSEYKAQLHECDINEFVTNNKVFFYTGFVEPKWVLAMNYFFLH